MDDLFYRMIFKRKSFHIFKGAKKLSEPELFEIEKAFYGFEPLVGNTQVGIKIVARNETSCPRGEYCLLLFSENKGNSLQNIGYIGEQLDLWLASRNIGVCWYGLGKTDQTQHNGLEFVMMMAIEKVDESEFRKDMFKSKRKPLEEIWIGNDYLNIANLVRFAPSSCNTQPWIVECSANKLLVYRYKKPGKRGMMPVNRVTFSNRIDMGIFILFLDVCLAHENYRFEKTLFADCGDAEDEKTLFAAYTIL